MPTPIRKALNIPNIMPIYHALAYFACLAVATVATHSLLLNRCPFKIISLMANNNHSSSPPLPKVQNIQSLFSSIQSVAVSALRFMLNSTLSIYPQQQYISSRRISTTFCNRNRLSNRLLSAVVSPTGSTSPIISITRSAICLSENLVLIHPHHPLKSLSP